ncbi:MAG: glycogen debranching protein [Actinomycetota bacterium]|nr:glycogen debranching protein [Actinomycetota bacterium]
MRWIGPALAGIVIALVTSAAAAPPATTLSTSERLGDRRYVAAGTRAYVVGAEDGRFPAMGWHVRGEMGGLWTPPLKLLDGLWFGLDGTWLPPANRFESGWGYVRMRLPASNGVEVTRTDFAPDGRRAVLVGLTLRSTGGARSVELRIQAHSELMSAYPWGWTTPSPSTFNLPDTASFDGQRLVFRETGTPHPNAGAHDWAAAVGSSLTPSGGTTGAGFRGPQEPPVVCPGDGPAPPRCDDSTFGKGAGGELRYALTVPAGQGRTVWFAVAGSDEGAAKALAEQAAVLRDPAAALRAKIASRRALGGFTQLSLPGDGVLQRAIDWSKQNLADSVQVAENLRIRQTDEGKQYPPPKGTVRRVRFLGAGFPDYPWLFATDGEYTAFASVAVGQFEPIKDHLRALREVSLVLNGPTGKVAHEVVTEGSVYFGSNTDPGNTDETAKFPSAVALVWRWTGDNRFRDELYGFAVKNMHYVVDQLDSDHDGWPEGLGNVERPGMGQEKLDNTVYTLRGLRDLATMAYSKNDVATGTWADAAADRMEAAFEDSWWMPEVPQYADSLHDPGDQKVQQRHWIGVTPMEAELQRDGDPWPGIAQDDRGTAALKLRERSCYGDANGLYHTGEPGCDPAVSTVKGERQIFTLNTAIMAVGEGNYGRLGRRQQARFTNANAKLQLPAPDEQPGAMPEIAPSPDYGRSIDRPMYDRAMVLQAWGAYGTVWPVVHQQLGVRPDLGYRRLEVTPQVPPYERTISGRMIRVGRGHVDVDAGHKGSTYSTFVRSTGIRGQLTIGHTVPHSEQLPRVWVDGRRLSETDFTVRITNRGDEVLVETTLGRPHRLVVKR